MNQRIECTLEAIVRNCPVRLHIPVELTYPEVLETLDLLKDKVTEMYKLAQKIQEDQQKKMSEKVEAKS